MQKLRITLIIFLLIASFNLAQAIPIIYNPQPTITVVFDEPVIRSTIDRELINTDTDENFELIDTYSSPDNTTFKYKPVALLSNGSYSFTIVANDTYGNMGSIQEQNFIVEIPAFKISINLPSFGVSSISPFEIEIKTNRYGECRYSRIDSTYVDMTLKFPTDDNLIHTINSYNSEGNFYIKCNDSYGNIHSKVFVLVYDTLAPGIEVHVDDAFQIISGIIKTKMTVTANEPVVCKYTTNNHTKGYAEMNYFSGLDETNIVSYKTNHEHNLTNTSDHLINYNQNYAYVICKDRANISSSKEFDEFTINTNQSPIIIINSPAPNSYTSDPTVDFDITTNKNSQCSYGPNENSLTPMAGYGTTHHTASTPSLTGGTHTYYIKCAFEEGDKTASTTFTIDQSKPIMVYVNATDPGLDDHPGYTYRTDRLFAKWLAIDNETSIAEYSYHIYQDYSYSNDILIESGTTSSTEEWVTGLDLNDSKKYYFKVAAKNTVGLWSRNKTSNDITVDVSKKPVSCNNNRQDGDETDVDCGGSCSACPDRKDCSENSDCRSKNCKNDVCKAATCNDEIKNSGETDVDCGGSCSKCRNGKLCKKDSDCSSRNCEKGYIEEVGVCSEFTLCSNDIKDSGETDVDCGGSCSACADEKKCKVNSDCRSKNCKSKVCNAAACDDGIWNGDETDVDCGGSSCSPCELGKKCREENDCESGTCKSAVCAESADKDKDGLPNEWEKKYALDPDKYDTDGNGISDADEDPDGDGLTNIEEYRYGTNPLNYDTDGDGYSDKEEIEAGTDPTDPESKPGSKIWWYLIFLLILVSIGAGAYYGYMKYNESLTGKKLMQAKAPLPARGKAPTGLPEQLIRRQRPGIAAPRIKEMPEKKGKDYLKRKSIFDKFGAETKKKAPEKKGKISKEEAVIVKGTKEEPKEKKKEKEDVFERLSEELPYKKKKR